MKATLVIAAVAASLLSSTATDVLAQGRNNSKHRNHNTGRNEFPQARQRSNQSVYNYTDGYGKNHGSYQGRGRKVGHYNKAQKPVKDKRRDAVIRDGRRERDGSIWNIFGR